MKTFDLPALVVTSEDSNISDLLVDRAKKTPDLALFARENGNGYSDISAKDFLAEVRLWCFLLWFLEIV